MWKEQYQRMYEPLVAREELVNETLERMYGQKRRPFYQRRMVFVIAMGVCLLFATPVLAARMPMVYTVLYGVSPEAAQFFVPVERACEDEGIRLEVIATSIHGAEAEVYFTLQDLTDDRLDETVAIYSFGLQSWGDKIGSAVGTCPLVHYDALSKTATFLLSLERFDGKPLTGRQLVLSLDEFFSGQMTYEDVPLSLALTDASRQPVWQMVDLTGGSITEPEHSTFDFEQASAAPYPVLVPESLADTPLDTIWLSGLAYVDGALHVQLAASDVANSDSHGDFYLVGIDGKPLCYDHSVCFDTQSIAYQEFVFLIDEQMLDTYALYGNFYASGRKVNGHWQVHFPLVNSAY